MKTTATMQKVNKHYRELFVNSKGVRYFILMGGRGAGRSTASSQYVLQRLRDTTKYFRCAIMRFVLGDIRNSIYQDIADRIEEEDLEDEVKSRENILKFSVGKNTIRGIGFRKSSGDQKSKLKSLAGFNVIVIEEADEVSEDDFLQLDDSLRKAGTEIIVILQLNPPDKNHWIVKRFFNLVDSGVEGFYKAIKKKSATNTCVISTTYRQNLHNMNESSIANYEAYKENDPDHYYNVIKGFVSEGKRGRIFKNWKPVSDQEYEDLPYPEVFGLDFGFSNHPTALVGIKKHNRKVWVRQLIYEKGLTNPMIAKKFEDVGLDGSSLIYADNAEPKSIRELVDLGFNVEPCEKGPDSVRAGVLDLIDRQIYYTEESVDVELESQNYMWRLDKNKESTNEPVDEWNHGIDAIRYGVHTDESRAYVGFG